MTHEIEGQRPSFQQSALAWRRSRRKAFGKSGKRKRLSLEILEPRVVLSQIVWNAAGSPTGGDWDVGSNWVGGHAPSTGDTAVIQGLTSPGTVYLDSNLADSIAGLTTDSSTTLEVNNGSLSLKAASSSTLGGPVDVASGAALNFLAGASVTLGSGQTLTDNGTLSFATGDSVSFPTAQFATTQIVVNGVLTATNTQFSNSGNANESQTQIFVNPNGELTASGSTFGIDEVYLAKQSTLKPGDLTDNTFNSAVYAPALALTLLSDNHELRGHRPPAHHAEQRPIRLADAAGNRHHRQSALRVSRPFRRGCGCDTQRGERRLGPDSRRTAIAGRRNAEHHRLRARSQSKISTTPALRAGSPSTARSRSSTRASPALAAPTAMTPRFCKLTPAPR